MEQNKMRDIEIEKMVLSCAGLGEKLEKSVELLKMISGKKPAIKKAKKRIPTFGISPGKDAGCMVTLRDKEEIGKLLKRFFVAVSNKIARKKITENHFSFGIHEYIEVPGLEYLRNIGILGFNITVVFKRKGKSVACKKIKRGKYPKKQRVTKEEIVNFLIKHFGVEITENDRK